MAKKKAPAAAPDRPVGPIIAKNLIRLGHADTSVKLAEVARLVTEKTGKSMSRQRVATILNAVKVNETTIEALAKGLGVKPSELLRDVD